MIEVLELRNFQSHKETVLEFEEGVNVIIGPSDSGKTSIIRALRWLAWNRPLGDAFRSNWGGDTSVKALLEDCEIERFEAKNDRYYKLYDPYNPNESDELVFKAFGTKVPEEIQNALNFSEINLQEQMDSPFLLSNNPGEVSRHFNKVANIDAIDSSQRAVESWIRSIKGDKKAADQEVERHEENLTEFNYLDKMEADVEVLEEMEGRKNKEAKQSNLLYDLVYKIEDVEQEISEKSDLIPAYSLVENILKVMKRRSKKIKKFKELKTLIFDIVDNEDDLEKSKELTDVEKPIQSILNLYEDQKELQNEIDFLVVALGKIEKTTTHIKRANNELDRLEEKWHQNMPEVCPLCGK